MKVDSGTVEYLLTKEFGPVSSGNLSRRLVYDYPILYDDTAEMGNHVVLLPQHERPSAQTGSPQALYICLGEASARSADDAGLAYLQVQEPIEFRSLYNFMQDVFVRNERLDARLQAYVSTYAGFQPLLKACAIAMGCSFSLVDSQFRPVAQAVGNAEHAGSSTADDGFDLLESEIIDLFMSSQRYRHMRASRQVFAVPGSTDLLMKNIFSDGRLVGTLAARYDGTAISARYVMYLLRYLGAYVEAMYTLMGSFGQSPTVPERVKAALADVQVRGEAGGAMLEVALAEAGHEPQSPYVVLKIERSFTHEGAEALDYLARRFELVWPNAYCFPSGEDLFMLADIGEGPFSVGAEFLHDLLPVARDNLTKVGVSKTFTDLRKTAQAIDQAGIALEQGKEAHPQNWYYRFEEYALPWLVSRISCDNRYASACHPAIEALIAYDSEHGAGLLDTLKTFMRCRYNATDASKALFVARSTLLNRLDRINELTGIDLDNPEERLYLALSLACRGL